MTESLLYTHPFDSSTINVSLALHQSHSEEDDMPEEELEADVEPILEQPGPGTGLGFTQLELPLRQEEFVELDRGEDAAEENLNEKKVATNDSCFIEVAFVFGLAWLAAPVSVSLCLKYLCG